MPDDLERRLRDIPRRVPLPAADVTATTRARVLELATRPRPRRRAGLSILLIAATFVGVAIGYWVIPRDVAIGAKTPPPVSVACRFDVSVFIVVDPARRRIVIRDGAPGATTSRVVGVFTPRGLVQHACRRVGQVHPRAFWGGHLFGVFSVRTRNTVDCNFAGPQVRLDSHAMKGGGHRLLITRESRPGTYSLFRAELRSPFRGGAWLEIPLCRRTPPT